MATKLQNYINAESCYTEMLNMTAQVQSPGCTLHKCMGSVVRPTAQKGPSTRTKDQILTDAEDFLKQFYEQSLDHVAPTLPERIEEVKGSVHSTGTYHLTTDELEFGLRTAWRNASRCIGRIQWKNLKVFDARQVSTGREMFEAVKTHLEYATNGGKIRSAITVFPPRQPGQGDFRVWNNLLVHYAGYRQPDGSVIGDPANVDFTEICQQLGWKGSGGRFDVLPVVVQAAGGPPECFEIPKDLAMTVRLKHPKFAWFEDLGLQWYAVPAVSSMLADVGGLEFTGCPFNGWFMNTEIGARDLCDPQRYNILQTVAHRLGLNTAHNASLWKDEALVEVNRAVLHSYQTAGVTLVDHHTASEQFMQHFETEHRIRGGCAGDWVWIVPPMSGSLCPVFHQEMLNYKLKPSYEYQVEGWKTYDWGHTTKKVSSFRSVGLLMRFQGGLLKNVLVRRPKCTILYATETGKSKTLAKKLATKVNGAFNVKVYCMDEYNCCDLPNEQLVLIVASTFGNGDSPQNGEEFSTLLKKEVSLGRQKYSDVRFGVFALGSSNYPHFCAFGKTIDKLLGDVGACRLTEVGTGDELSGQDDSFADWANSIIKVSMAAFNVECDNSQLTEDESKWTDFEYRFMPHQQSDILTELCKWTTKTLYGAVVKECKQLQAPETGRETVQVVLKTGGNFGLAYAPGDHLAVYPQNDPKLVQDILDLVTQDPDSPVVMQCCKKGASVWSVAKKFPVGGLTVREVFRSLLDITTPLAQRQLLKLADVVSSEDDRQQLLRLATNTEAYQQWKSDLCPTLLDVLLQFPSLQRLDLTRLLLILPSIQPRFYSISSSPRLCPGEIHLTSVVFNYTTESGSTRLGVCSNYLKNLKAGETVACFVRSAAKFHLPDDQAPLILVGPGTGIAPFRGFWQHKFAMAYNQADTLGDIRLYHGCRYQNADNLYHDERQLMFEKQILKENQTAFSRQTGIKKTYVQNLLSENGPALCEEILGHHAHIYVCGDVIMAQEVRTAIESILQGFGDMTAEKAQEFIVNMRAINRYHEDIFGSLKDNAPQRPVIRNLPE